MEERESVKAALGGLNGGSVFNEAVAAQYHQAKQQQIAEKLEVQQLQNQVPENVETWESLVKYQLRKESLFVSWPKILQKWIGALNQ